MQTKDMLVSTVAWQVTEVVATLKHSMPGREAWDKTLQVWSWRHASRALFVFVGKRVTACRF